MSSRHIFAYGYMLLAVNAFVKEVIEMDSEKAIKEIVREKYGAIADKTSGGGCCGSSVGTCFSDDYTQLTGYVPDADLGLGCGTPTGMARIREGDVVLDLGSGAGNDAFVARSAVGETGRVIGVDMTPSMINKARENAAKLGYRNVEFRLGDIESLPVDSKSIDVVISNCVLNLVPDKRRAFMEIRRVLKPGGKFSISDIVSLRDLPDQLRRSAESYVGCVAGAIQRDAYLDLIRETGFQQVRIASEKRISIPREFFEDAAADANAFSEDLLLSITVYGENQA